MIITPRLLSLSLLLACAGRLAAQTPEWIWSNKTEDAEIRHFRKAFTIADKVTKAEIIATADDELEVFLNGALVITAIDWHTGSKADVTSKLVVGENVIAIRAQNADASPAGAIAKLDFTTAKGSQSIVTDSSWKGADKGLKDWNKVGFDDSKWSAVKSLGKLGIEPWGNVLGAAIPAGVADPAAPKPVANKRAATSAESLFVAKDFQVELLTSGEPEEGSWVNMCKDDKGRLIISPQYGKSNPDAGLLRVTLGKDGKIAKREFIAKPLYDAQGMVFAYGSLWVVINKYSTKFESGLYRITDDGSDTWSKIELVKKMPGGGEHGPHAVELGPDGNLWVMAGNHTKPPEGLAPDSPHKNYREDHVLPRQPDGNGHATGVMAPGGYILRVNKDATKFDLFCAGFRNQFDFAFNVDGELFVYDADMEYDWGVPWYRPTRVNHAVSGAEFGWRYGTGKWPDYHADSLGAAADIGLGCPTGVGNGKGAKFPAKYQQAIYIMDWTFGRLMAVHLQPDGASYQGTFENFVAPAGLVKPGAPKPPLNLTDLIIGDDGAMYFTIGGRGTPSGLYRVTYTGQESTAPAWRPNTAGAEARKLRHQLEAFHGKADPKALDFLWPHLNSPDRSIRYAGRIALEAQPVAQWQERALAEKSADGGPTALLALARLGGKAAQDECFRALAKWPLDTLTEVQQLTKLRALQVSIARDGQPSADVAKATVEKLNTSYPNKADLVNRELSQVLIALGAPEVVGKTLQVMAAAKNQEEMMHYFFHLRTAKKWTADQHREYLGYWTKDRNAYTHEARLVQWFQEAGRPYSDGASYGNFRKNFLKDKVSNLSEAEKTELEPLLATIASGQPAGRKPASAFPAAKPRAFVKDWKTADLAPSFERPPKGRNFEKGRQAFVDAQCLACHRFGNEGAGTGPDLTAVASRFGRRDILESLTEPSKVLSEQYQNTTVTKKDGVDVTGRLVEETADKLVLVPDPLKPNTKMEVKKTDVKSRTFSKLSPMPEGLVSGLSQEDILDLVAFLEAAGRKDHPAFAK